MKAISAEQLAGAERQVAEACRKHDVYAIIGHPVVRETNSTTRLPSSILVARFSRTITKSSSPNRGRRRGIGYWFSKLMTCRHASSFATTSGIPNWFGCRCWRERVSCSASRTSRGWTRSRSSFRIAVQIQARAVENTVYVVQANAPANTDSTGSHGQSRLIAPDGNLIEEASIFGENVIAATLELEQRDRASSTAKYWSRGPLADWWRAGVAKVELIGK